MTTLGASRLEDHSKCNDCGVVGPANVASGNVQTNSKGALRMGNRGTYPQCCSKQAPVQWVASQGAATVWINTEPAVAITHTATHIKGRGAMIEASGNVFVGGPSNTMEELARADAVAMVDKGLASLNRWNEEDKRHFKEWFGTDSEEARELMRQRLLKMREKLLHEELVVGSKEDTWAHVWPWENTVNLDKRFWDSPRTGEDSRAGTLIHETSHFWGTGGTNDAAYGRPGCRSLAAQDPQKAMHNADNHEYWMETL